MLLNMQKESSCSETKIKVQHCYHDFTLYFINLLICLQCNCLSQYFKFKSNLSLYSLYCGEACNEFSGPISASLRTGNTASFEEMSQRRRTVGNTVFDLTGPRFEPQTSRSRDERVTARPTGRLWQYLKT